MLIEKSLTLFKAALNALRSHWLLALFMLLVSLSFFSLNALSNHLKHNPILAAAARALFDEITNKPLPQRKPSTTRMAKPKLELKSSTARLDQLQTRLALGRSRPLGENPQRQNGSPIPRSASEEQKESLYGLSTKLRSETKLGQSQSTESYQRLANKERNERHLRLLARLLIGVLLTTATDSWKDSKDSSRHFHISSDNSEDSEDSSDDNYDSGYSWAKHQDITSSSDCDNAFSGLLWGGGSGSFSDGCRSYLNNQGLLDIFDESEYEDDY